MIDLCFIRDDPNLTGNVRNVDEQITPMRTLPASRFGHYILSGFLYVVEKVRAWFDRPIGIIADLHQCRPQIAFIPGRATSFLEGHVTGFVIEETEGNLESFAHVAG